MQGIKKDYDSDITHHKDELIHQVFIFNNSLETKSIR